MGQTPFVLATGKPAVSPATSDAKKISHPFGKASLTRAATAANEPFTSIASDTRSRGSFSFLGTGVACPLSIAR